jgi:hypothetical protein
MLHGMEECELCVAGAKQGSYQMILSSNSFGEDAKNMI